MLDDKVIPNTSVNQALAQVAASQQAAVSQAIAQAVASHAVGNPDEPYSAEVAAIVQNVVSAHMDEVLAARNYQSNLLLCDTRYAIRIFIYVSFKIKIAFFYELSYSTGY